jgi:SpoVK/Ycf46/Vps4 family AAA+-type ATPase
MRLLPHLRLVIGFHPSILRETINYPSASFQSKETVTRNIDAAINELIMPKEIKFLLQDLARNVCNIRFQSDESCSPILFHGPDGKRMAAMMLAKAIGMNFAHVNGQDVITTGQEGTTQLQTLFAWTKLCSDGVLLFIDNADAFLPHSMNNLSTGDKKQNALSTFICNMNNLQQNIILVLGIKW